MDIALLANEVIVLFDEWGLDQWTFQLGNRKRSLGTCYYGPKVIEISEHHARNDPKEIVLDTLKHEIAHALAGYHVAPHGSEWKEWARKVGCSPDACVAIAPRHVPLSVEPGKWFAVCPCCGKEFNKYRKPKHITGRYCMDCGSEKGCLTYQERK